MPETRTTRFLDRFAEVAGSPAKAETIVDRLSNGETPADLVRSSGLEPLELVAALGVFSLGASPDSLGPSLVQTAPSRPELRECASTAELANLFPNAAEIPLLCLSAGLFQILDFWDESHHSAQLAADLGDRGDSAYWHAIAHRREPDAGNARYWFRRVGRHPIFPSLVESRSSIEELSMNSISEWDPFAFVDLCYSRPQSPIDLHCRRIQRLEMLLLLDSTCRLI